MYSVGEFVGAAGFMKYHKGKIQDLDIPVRLE